MSVSDAIYVRAWAILKDADVEYPEKIINFTYTYATDGPDKCAFTIETQDFMAPDLPEYQERVKVKVVWGYTGKISVPIRTMYIRKATPEYVDNVVRIRLELADKSHSLVQKTNNNDYSEKTFAEVVQEITGGDNRMKVFYGEDKEAGESYTFGTIYTSQKRIQQEVLVNPIEGVKAEAIGIDNKGFPLYTAPVDNTSAVIFDMFQTTAKILPGANRNDKQVLDDVLEQAPGGPYIAETRDDAVTIKKRGLGKAPYKSYRYSGEQGELLSFKPETKQDQYGKASTKITAGSWSIGDKEYNQQNITELDDDNTRLGEVGEVPEDFVLEGAEYMDGEAPIVQNQNLKIPDSETFGVPIRVNTQNVGTQVIKSKQITDPATGEVLAEDNYSIYTNAVENTGVVIEDVVLLRGDRYGEYLNTGTTESKSDPNASAANARTNASLKKNPATAKLVGDPHVTSDMVITILGVAQKYQGNYWIEEVEHTIGDVYTMNLTLRRTGKGKTGNEIDGELPLFTKPINNEIGPEGSTQDEVDIPEVNVE